MSFVYKYFDGILIPEYNIEQDLSTGVVPTALVETVNGRTVSYLGNNRRLPRGHRIRAKGIYASEASYLVDGNGNYLVDGNGNFLFTGGDADSLREQVNKIRAVVGKQSHMQRENWDDGTQQFKNARLLQVKQVQRSEQRQQYVILELIFEIDSEKWINQLITTTTGTLTSGANTVVVDSLGNETVEDAIIQITPTGGALTSVEFALGDCDWAWSGSVTSGNIWDIRSGPEQVQNQGNDAYSGFTLGANHLAPNWIVLQPESNELTLTVDQACNYTVFHFDQWM